MNSELMNLDLIEVASPCPTSWEAMKGDQRVRFCRECRQNVYNLSDMTRGEAVRIIQHREGRICVRFYRRADGTVLTRDCPVGLRALRQRFVRGLAAIAGLMIALLSGTLFGGVVGRRTQGLSRPLDSFANWIAPERQLSAITGKFVLGGCSAPPVPIQSVTAQAAPGQSPLAEPAQ